VSTFFTSDTHFGHANIIRYSSRPYPDVDVMNDGLVDAWNDTVRPADEVWHLGDVVMGNAAETLRLVPRLHGRKLLVPGNHDRCWEGHRSLGPWRQRYIDAGFTVLPSQVTTTLADREVLLCHFPYSGDSHDEDRYRSHRPLDRGQWLVHGHVHEKWRQAGRQVNVGTDVWDYRPVAAEAVEDLIRAGEHDLDRWGSPATGPA
jgi:calcineurin-like phosphoesterase family protein